MLWIEYRARVGRRTDFADDFNRADNGDINASAPMTWTDNASVMISSNQLIATSGFDEQVQIGTAITYSNQWCEIDHVSDPNVGTVGLTVRASAVPTDTYYGFRFLGVFTGSPTAQWQLYKRITGTYTLLDSLVESAPSTPFRMLLEVDATSVRGYHVTGGGNVLKCTGTLDGSITGTRMAVWMQKRSGNAVADNFEAGEL